MSRAKLLLLCGTILLATTEVGAADVLPVVKGFYVQSDVPCDQTKEGVMFEYRGPQTAAGTLLCSFDGGTRVKTTFTLKTNCVDRSSGARQRSTSVYVVQNRTTLAVNGTLYRLCPLASLPAPWNKAAD